MLVGKSALGIGGDQRRQLLKLLAEDGGPERLMEGSSQRSAMRDRLRRTTDVLNQVLGRGK
jgi:hypothetical protein